MPQLSYVDLCQLTLSYRGTSFPTETRFLAAILNHKAVKSEAAVKYTGKDVLEPSHVSNKVSVTMCINIISYILICWVYYGLPVPSPLIPPQLLLKMKPDLDPTIKTWYK